MTAVCLYRIIFRRFPVRSEEPVLCTELEDNQKIRLLKEGNIQAGEALFAVDIYE